MKYNERKTFKRKANEKQFKINAQVIDQLDIASEQLEANELNKVRDTLTEGMRILKEPEKLILIADSEKHGWKVAEEYETHELAENEEDEKRLWKAHKGLKKESKRTARRRSTNGGRQALSHLAWAFNHSGFADQQSHQLGQHYP